MRKFLKYVNSMPFPYTVKHYHVFDNSTPLLKDGKLDSVESWDALRVNHEHFSIASSREEWLKASDMQIKKDGQDGGLYIRAKEIVAILTRLGITHLFSVGVGGAGLEYQIKKLLPTLNLTSSEYSPLNVEMLKKVFIESNSIIEFDVNHSDWSTALQGVSALQQLCLIYRVDAQINDEEWCGIFTRIYDAGIQHILFVPSSCLTLRGYVQRKLKQMQWTLKKIPYAFAGYLRTQKKFESFWKQNYKEEIITVGGYQGFLLRKK